METPEQTDPPDQVSETEILRLFLNDRNVKCPLCGYNLRGQTARCPECGRELRLSIGLAEPFLRAWLWLAIAVFGSAGIGILFIMLVLRLGWPRRLHGYGDAALTYFIVSPVLLIPTLKGRRRFLRMAHSSQWFLAMVALVVTVASILAFVATLR